jgi:hypothetical protein
VVVAAPVIPAPAIKVSVTQLPAQPSPSVAVRQRNPAPAPAQVAVVAQQEPAQSVQEDQVNGPRAVRIVTQKEAVGWRIRPQMQQEVLTWRNTTARWLVQSPNPFLLSRLLGLTDEQRSRIAATQESYSRNIVARQEQIEKEESLYNTLLEADQFDRNAALAQFDRVIQARAELERTNAAMSLEMRESLTQAQWIQLQTTFRLPYLNDRLYAPNTQKFQWPVGQRSQQ